jgi:hypothetical protein
VFTAAPEVTLLGLGPPGVAGLTVFPITDTEEAVDDAPLSLGVTGVTDLTTFPDDTITEGELITGPLTGVILLTMLPPVDIEGRFCLVVVEPVTLPTIPETEVVAVVTGVPIDAAVTTVVLLTTPSDTGEAVVE